VVHEEGRHRADRNLSVGVDIPAAAVAGREQLQTPLCWYADGPVKEGAALSSISKSDFSRIKTERTRKKNWHRVLGVNLDGPFYCCKAAVPAMMTRGCG
jgi:NAD(P)-dependent dehydrogenase (short-subunit alcohol dehydrogenase family)